MRTLAILFGLSMLTFSSLGCGGADAASTGPEEALSGCAGGGGTSGDDAPPTGSGGGLGGDFDSGTGDSSSSYEPGANAGWGGSCSDCYWTGSFPGCDVDAGSFGFTCTASCVIPPPTRDAGGGCSFDGRPGGVNFWCCPDSDPRN